MNEVRQSYRAWVVAVNEEMTLLSRHLGAFCCILDSRLAYNLHWSPSRTARALLGFDGRDRQRLIDLQRAVDAEARATDLPAALSSGV